MNRDPFYTQIVEKLTGKLDADLFEDCASNLLRSIYPGLTPMRGGSDSGMDGAIADNSGEPYPLVTTTSSDVIGNLTRNLKTYLRDGGLRRVTVLATSQELTPRKKKNLYERARKLDFELRNIHDQAAFADLLYNSPCWCLELLNLPSSPQPLSKTPQTERPFLNAPLVGRDASLDWLRQTKGDRLLLGQPGSGKTFLLHKLAQEDKGLFLVTSERDEIASGIRSQIPSAIFVDDAARNRDLLTTLCHMRQEMGVNFDIIATGWPGEEAELIQSLNLPLSQVHHLEHLTRDEIVEVIHGAGVEGSERLIKEIVDQAEGRPGLAVTLTLLCLQGGSREVVFGDSLSTFVLDFTARFIGEQSEYILATLSLAGNQGLTLPALAQILNTPITDLHRTIKQLDASGVVMEVMGNQITVRPPALRYALIRKVFFTRVNLPIEPILVQIPNRVEATLTLIGTRSRGANIPDHLLRSLVSELSIPDLWEAYAWLGKNEAEWAYYQCLNFLKPIAMPGLINAPNLYLPTLLASCVGDQRPLHSNPDHFLRLIEDWIKSADLETNEVLARRQTLLTAVEKWLSSHGNWNVGGKALQFVMSPQFESNSTDPGAGRRFSIRNGIVSLDNLNKIKILWQQILSLLTDMDIEDWSPLHGLIEEWAYPGRFGLNLPKNISNNMTSFAEQMLRDVILLTTQHPGTLHWAYELAKNCGFKLEISLDADFETLYPFYFRDEDLHKSQEQWEALLNIMSNEWSTKAPETIAHSLYYLESEARNANITWPRLTEKLCANIANISAESLSWVKAFLAANLSGDLIYPFLKRAMEANETGWELFFIANLNNPTLQGSIVPLILTSTNPPDELLIEVLGKLDQRLYQWIHLVCTQRAIPEKHLHFLLTHKNSVVAQAAAEGEWLAEPKGVVRQSLKEDWEKAILQSNADIDSNQHYWLGEILSKEPDISFRWLSNFISKSSDKTSTFLYRNVIRSAISCLTHSARLKLLEKVPNEYGFDTFILDLVSRSPEMYKHLLEISHLQRYHLIPLSGDTDSAWFELAMLATQAGYNSNDIATATMNEYLDTLSNMDGEADKWSEWIKRFENIKSDTNPIFIKIVEAGIELATKRLKSAQSRIRNESIYGYL